MELNQRRIGGRSEVLDVQPRGVGGGGEERGLNGTAERRDGGMAARGCESDAGVAVGDLDEAEMRFVEAELTTELRQRRLDTFVKRIGVQAVEEQQPTDARVLGGSGDGGAARLAGFGEGLQQPAESIGVKVEQRGGEPPRRFREGMVAGVLDLLGEVGEPSEALLKSDGRGLVGHWAGSGAVAGESTSA